MYDSVIENYFGVLKGGPLLVFIKAGRGGSVYGYQNKYLDLATEIRNRFGCSVVVSANPDEMDCDLPLEISYINDKIFPVSDIVYVGVSNGAVIGALQGHSLPQIKKMILVNGPLMINFHKFIEGLQRFGKRRICAIYGEKDPSKPYTCLFEQYRLDNFEVRIAKGCDHNFKDKEHIFRNAVIQALQE